MRPRSPESRLYNPPQPQWDFQPGAASAPTKSCRLSAQAEWGRFTRRATRGSIAAWRSRFSRRSTRSTPSTSRASRARRRRLRRSTIPTSSASSTSARRTRSRTSRWSSIEGKTLAELLAPGPLSIKKVLDLAIQIADGLAAAHEAGIVHRDLKPANVMVTSDGFAKILDFGLARTSSTEPSGSSVETEPPPTLTGEIVGTAGYMSPEQARGEPVRFPTDQFSFGSVLYEMATGKRAFRGNTRIDTLSAVLNEEPEPISKLRPGVPRASALGDRAVPREGGGRPLPFHAGPRQRGARDPRAPVGGVRERSARRAALPRRRRLLLGCRRRPRSSPRPRSGRSWGSLAGRERGPSFAGSRSEAASSRARSSCSGPTRSSTRRPGTGRPLAPT